jgi:hypothetical protein
MEGHVRQTRDAAAFHNGNCIATTRYLRLLEARREECFNLTGVDTQAAKTEVTLVQHGLSTVYEIVEAKIRANMEEFLPVVTARYR